jgi:hypothetical protein
MKKVSRIPILVKVLYTAYVAATVYVYESAYGPQNFLWFSDIALIVTVAALWFESSLLASMMAVGILVPETGWIVAFLFRLITRAQIHGVTGYMFGGSIPLAVRALSLFHLFLPPLLVWMVYRLGYDRRAWIGQSGLCWAVYVATFWLTDSSRNINWAFGLGGAQHLLPPMVYLLAVMVAVPLGIYLPTDWALRRLFPRGASSAA